VNVGIWWGIVQWREAAERGQQSNHSYPPHTQLAGGITQEERGITGHLTQPLGIPLLWRVLGVLSLFKQHVKGVSSNQNLLRADADCRQFP